MIAPPAAHPTQHRQNEKDEHHKQPEQGRCQHVFDLVLARLNLGGNLARLILGQRQLGDDCIGPGLDPAGHVASLEGKL